MAAAAAALGFPDDIHPANPSRNPSKRRKRKGFRASTTRVCAPCRVWYIVSACLCVCRGFYIYFDVVFLEKRPWPSPFSPFNHTAQLNPTATNTREHTKRERGFAKDTAANPHNICTIISRVPFTCNAMANDNNRSSADNCSLTDLYAPSKRWQRKRKIVECKPKTTNFGENVGRTDITRFWTTGLSHANVIRG